LIFLFLLSLSSRAQHQSHIDSLKKLLSFNKGKERFSLLNDIGFAYRLSYPDSTIYYCNLAYDLGKELGFDKELSKPLSFIGLASAYKGDYKTSFDFHLRAIEVAEQQNDSLQLAYCYNNFGRLFFDQGDLTRAYDNLIKALNIFEAIQDPAGLAYVYRSLSNIYKSQNDFPKALEMSLKAYALRKSVGEPRGLLSALSELGLVHSEMKNKAGAERCFEQADSIAQRISDFISVAELRIGWAEFLANNDDVEKARSLAQQAYRTVVETSNNRLMPRANLLMGQVHYKLAENKDAISFLEKVVDNTGEAHLDLQRDAHFYLSKIYEKLGKQAEATRYTNKYLVLKESLVSVELARQIEKLQFQLEIEKKERENELLKANEARSESIIQQQKLENITLLAVAAFVSALFFMQWRNNKKRKETSDKLARQNEEIAMQREENILQNERLAKRNLELSDLNHEKDTLMNIVAHDLKSPLNRIKGLADLIEMEGELSETQKKYVVLIRDSTRSGLDLINDLLDVNSLDVNREPNYSTFDLHAFVVDRMGTFRHYASAKEIELKIIGDHADVSLDQDYLARVLDNLISNAIKFSPRNSRVILKTSHDEGRFSISVKDEGQGFTETDRKYLYQKFRKLSARPTAGESSNGLGLAIVKILVDRMGGEVELKSEPGHGSEFVVRFPIKHKVIA
jgi:signal transduction histidine kinase